MFLTPFIVLLLDTVQPGDWEVAAVRSLDTVIGGLLALFAGYLLWPSWERERLPEQLARTIAANRDYFLGVVAGYRGQTSDPGVLRSARRQAQLENANAAAAFQRLLSEPEAAARLYRIGLCPGNLQPTLLRWCDHPGGQFACMTGRNILLA